MSNLPKNSPALVFKNFGNPEEVLRFDHVNLDAWNDNSVHLRMLAAPINPSDYLSITGIYPASLPKDSEKGFFIPGFEGVACVQSVGKNVSDLKIGDFVLPGKSSFGTWRREIVCPASDVMKVPNTLPVKALATTIVNPTTALRMLEDFIPLKSGDTIVQNAANSTVGQAVIQMAKTRGIKTINIMRDRKNFDEVRAFLRNLGADVVLKEGELLSYLKENPTHIPLAFNAVGGRSGTDLAFALGTDGILVTYGRLSEEPMIVPVADFIFKNIHLCGFWLSTWMRTHSSEDSDKMFHEIFRMMQSGELKVPPMDEVHFSDLGKDVNAVKNLFKEGERKKILIFS